MSEMSETKRALYEQVERLEREIEVNDNKIVFYEERLGNLIEANKKKMNQIGRIMRDVRMIRAQEERERMDEQWEGWKNENGGEVN